MRPNKVETAVQWFHMSLTVFAGFSGCGYSTWNSLLEIFLNEPEPICLHTAEWFPVLRFNTYNAIQHYSFICTQLNDFKCRK